MYPCGKPTCNIKNRNVNQSINDNVKYVKATQLIHQKSVHSPVLKSYLEKTFLQTTTGENLTEGKRYSKAPNLPVAKKRPKGEVSNRAQTRK